MTIYGNKHDYRAAMREPTGSSRAHAMCRKLTGVFQDSIWYGAHYWAACGMLDLQFVDGKRTVGTNVRFALNCFLREVENKISSSLARNLFNIAWYRCLEIRDQAIELKSSILW